MTHPNRFVAITLVLAFAITSLAADAAWKWSGSFGDKAVELLILGDIQIHSRRADPTTAFHRMRDTLKKADLVYANLEGLLVKSVGTTIDIPDKPEWTHPGPDGVKALKAANIAVVGVANNVASGRDSILKSLAVLDANGILHAGAGRNIDEAHKPAIVDAQRRQDRLPAVHRALVSGQGHDRDRHRGRRREDHVAGRQSRSIPAISSACTPTSRSSARSSTSSSSRITIATASTPVQFGAVRGTSAGRDRSKTEEYQKQFARVALDTGADFVFGHGTHTIARRGDLQRQADPLRDRPLDLRSARLREIHGRPCRRAS